jgi:tRNA threonylcarbamoyl adenosine modification protein (Sua5/YciO/YrdC/YwlC family)
MRDESVPAPDPVTPTPVTAPVIPVAPSTPEADVVHRAVAALAAGGVIAFPTDTLYGLGCEFGRTEAIERIQKMRGFDGRKRPLTLLLPDIGELPHYAIASESAYRILQRIFPGPYRAELLAMSSVPAPFLHQGRETIGVRIPDSPLCEKMLWRLGRPMLTATAKSRADEVLTTAQQIQREYGADLDLILDGGTLMGPPSTVVSLVHDWVTVLREGRGPSNKILVG